MRRLYSILLTISITATAWAQSPQKMSYQAIIRNSSNILVTSSAVGIKFSILQSSPDGITVYTETQTPTTNSNGLVTIEIGGGPGFDTINWANGAYFIKTEIDPTGGTDYTIIGVSQLLSVPYALHAKTSGSTDGTTGHYIGQIFGGGVIFYIDKTGQHGLIVSPVDINSSYIWSNVTSTAIGSSARSTWDGKSNTAEIIIQPSHTMSAALLCTNYRGGDYSDWYLPAIDELNKLYNSRYEVNKVLGTNGIKLDYYYSSTEVSTTTAMVSFAVGAVNESSKSGTWYVRAVRTF